MENLKAEQKQLEAEITKLIKNFENKYGVHLLIDRTSSGFLITSTVELQGVFWDG